MVYALSYAVFADKAVEMVRSLELEVRPGRPVHTRSFNLPNFGISQGAYWDFVVSGPQIGSGTERDSVYNLMPNYTGPVFTCNYTTPIQLAEYQSRHTSDSLGTQVDTFLFYYDGTYYYEYYFRNMLAPLRIMKSGAVYGDSWTAWDTCVAPFNVKVPLGDIDGDFVPDTFVFIDEPGSAVVDQVVGSRYKVNLRITNHVYPTAPYHIVFGADTFRFDSLKYVRSFFRITLVSDTGRLEFYADSLTMTVYAVKVDSGIVDTNVIIVPIRDTSGSYQKVSVLLGLSELVRPNPRGKVTFYSIDGRKLPYIPNRKGVYILVEGNKIRKVIRR